MLKIRQLFIVSFTLITIFCLGQNVVFVETESFEDKGGWVSDHQAFEKIKSAYIMAHGLGRPVKDAVTTVDFDKPGTYHVYVSTYNWTSPWYDKEGPGAFQILVDEKVLPNKLGVTGDKWEWKYAGEVKVSKNKSKVALRDLTGFNGRADAIYFSTTKEPPTQDYTEMQKKRREYLGYTEFNRVPKVDLVVVGGGIAGCATALTAARYGLKVAIVDNLPWLGGSNVLGVKACGLMYENLYPELGNITCQVLGVKLSEKNNPDAYIVNKKNNNGHVKFSSYEDFLTKPVTDDRSTTLLKGIKNLSELDKQKVTDTENDLITEEYHRQNASTLREKLLRDAGVSIYQNINVYDVTVKNKQITSVRGKSLRNGEEYVFEGTLFADCTGDGVLGYLAGADYLTGRESQSFANEPSAPDVEDKKMMGSSMEWFAFRRDNSGTFPKVDELPWAMQCSDDYHIVSNQAAWWWETGLEIDNAKEAELVRDNFLRAVFGNWAYLKNHHSKYADFRLDYLQHIGMKRESRRLTGDIVLNENDVKNQVKYPDASFTTTWAMDLHYAKPDNTKYFPGWEWITYCTNKDPQSWIKPYHVPYRCLYSRSINNLFIGGRNMSVTHQALGTVRVQSTLGMAGEVIGMAAKICTDNNVFPRAVYTSHLSQLIDYMKAGVPLK